MPSAPGNDARLEINRILNWLSVPIPGYAQPTALLQQMPRYPYPAYAWPHGPPTLPQYPPHPQSGGWTGPQSMYSLVVSQLALGSLHVDAGLLILHEVMIT